MKVVKTNNNKRAMTLAELEALAQFEASDRKGQVVFHPWVVPGSPAPHCVVLPEGSHPHRGDLPGRRALGRGRPVVPPGRRWRGDAHRRRTGTLLAGRDGRSGPGSRKQLGINAYVVAVAVFPTMEPDESILAAAASRGTRVLFRMDDHVERLAALPGEQDLQHPLQARYIPDDAEALSRPPASSCGGTGDGVPGRWRWPRGDLRWHRPPPPPPAHHHRGRSQRRRRRR